MIILPSMALVIEAVGTISSGPLAIFFETKQLSQKELIICSVSLAGLPHVVSGQLVRICVGYLYKKL